MPAGRHLRRLAQVSLAGLMVVSACAGGDPGADAPPPTPGTESTAAPPTTSPATAAPATTAPPTQPDATAPPTTAPPDTTAPFDSEDTENEPAVLADDLPCVPAWAERTGDEITFTRGRDLFSYRPDTGEVSCLARLDREPTAISWSPDGRTLLVDADVLVDASGSRPSGFAPGTAGIRWSKPNGRALIAPSADGSQLVHIDIDDAGSARDVGALVETWVADYHPSGEAIVSAGVDADGRRGLFLADNEGGQLTQLVTLDDPADTITDVSFGHDGRWVNFVHDHAGADDGVAAHVHRFDLVGVFVNDIATLEDVVPTGLVTSRQADGSIAYELSRSTVSSSTEFASGVLPPVVAPRTSEHRLEPVGFVDGGSLVGVSRPVPERDAPGRLQVVAADGEVTVIAGAVGEAAPRVAPFPTWEAPPLGVILQAVG